MATSDTDLHEITASFDKEPLHQQTMNNVLENRARELSSRTYINYGPEDRAVSFDEMNEAANAIGQGLVDLGVERADKVSVLLRHPLETLFAMFGIHKAGGVYSPINFEYKGAALSYQLNDTTPKVLFVEDQYISRLNTIKNDLDRLPYVVVFKTDTETASLDEAFERTSLATLRDSPSNKPEVEVSWHNEASIVYTSGTTGKPKGVVLPHRWIFANYTLFFGQVLNEDDVVHTSLPLYHVGGVYADVVAALVSGSSVALWDQFSPNEFWDRIEMYGATKTILLSVMVPWLAQQSESPDDPRNPLKMVHMQPLPDSYDELAERFGLDIVTAGFGQTEAGVPLVGVIHANPDGTPEEVLKGLDESFETILASDQEYAELNAKRLTDYLFDVTAAALLLDEAQWAIDNKSNARKAVVAHRFIDEHLRERSNRGITEEGRLPVEQFDAIVRFASVPPEAIGDSVEPAR
jgi:crotonobetaine/carnitine-CoA ligase